MSTCGLDFGTSHSTLSVLDKDNTPTLISYNDDGKVIRSAIFFDYESNKVIFGQNAIITYLAGIKGRLMVGLKSILGSSLMEESTVVMGKPRKYKDILALYIEYLKSEAEKQLGYELTNVVAGRPVRFCDEDDKKDNLAQSMLHEVLESVGFKNIKFQYEPVAAAFDYWQQATKDTTIVIADLGGGTCDFTAMQLPIYGKGTPEILSTGGIHIGGTDLDSLLNIKTVMPKLGLGSKLQSNNKVLDAPSSIYYDLSTWHSINWLYQNKAINDVNSWYPTSCEKDKVNILRKVLNEKLGHSVLHETERVKRELSYSTTETYEQSQIDKSLKFNVTQAELNSTIQESTNKLQETMEKVIKDANISKVDMLYFTGGTSYIPLIQQTLSAITPSAHTCIEDLYGSVGKGLAEFSKI